MAWNFMRLKYKKEGANTGRIKLDTNRALGYPTSNGNWSWWNSPISTEKLLFVRYDANQSNAVPQMPTSRFNLFNKMRWSTVSKAALRSNNKSSTVCRYKISFTILLKELTQYYSLLWSQTEKDPEYHSNLDKGKSVYYNLFQNFVQKRQF